MQKSKQVKIERTTRFDGWLNLFSGLGRKGIDKRQDTSFDPPFELSEDDLINIYRADGLGTRVIDCYTEDMTRKGFKVTGDTDNDVAKAMKEFKGVPAIIEATRWALLMGGSVGIMGIDDGGTYEDIVDEGNIRAITHIHVYDRWRAVWTTADLYSDPMSPMFGTPEFYTIFPINPSGAVAFNARVTGENLTTASSSSGTSAPTVGSFRVHESRILRFDGKQIPLRARIRNRYWSDSYLLAGYERLKGMGEAYASVETILSEFIVGTLTIDNLSNLLAMGKESIVQQRLALMDRCRRTLSTKLLDLNEKYERVTSSVSGMADLIDKLAEGVSAAYGIPITRLLGRSPAGMNATGDSDESIYYDKIGGMQLSMQQPPLEKLVRYIMLCKEGRFAGKELEDWEVEFVPLKALSEKEQVDLRKTVAETDQIYIQNGVVSQGEVALSRFGGESYSAETQLSVARDSEGELPEPEGEEGDNAKDGKSSSDGEGEEKEEQV